MAIIRSPLFSKYHTDLLTEDPNNTGKKIIQWSLDARRATIFFRRLGATDASRDIGYGGNSPNVNTQPALDEAWANMHAKKDRLRYGETIDGSLTHKNIHNNNESLSDYVAIINIDKGGRSKGLEIIKLPFVPKELSYNTESTFATIKPIGANNPRYHYTGSEDKLEFEIDWLSFDEDRRDVITQCRKIEALSKADGYRNSPPRVLIQWGKFGFLFEGIHFIVLSAPYRMTQFSKGHVNSQGVVQRTHMLSVQAYQKVTLARISSKNLSTNDIEFVANNKSTSSLI